MFRLINLKACKLILFLFCLSCSPNKPEDFRSEGLAIIRNLTQDLKEIRSEEDLKKKAGQLTKKFNRLAQLVLEVHQWRKKHPDLLLEDFEECPESLQLQKQLKRICLLSEGKQMLETCQKPALDKLKKILP